MHFLPPLNVQDAPHMYAYLNKKFLWNTSHEHLVSIKLGVLRSGFLANHRSPITESSICRYRSPIPIFLKPSFYYVELFIVILQSGFLDIYSGPEFHFWEWIPLIDDSCEGIFFNLRGGGGIFYTFFKNIYLSDLNVWSCSAFLFLQSCDSLHTAQAWFCELYMRWPFMPGSHIGLLRLQCVFSPCVVR